VTGIVLTHMARYKPLDLHSADFNEQLAGLHNDIDSLKFLCR